MDNPKPLQLFALKSWYSTRKHSFSRWSNHHFVFIDIIVLIAAHHYRYGRPASKSPKAMDFGQTGAYHCNEMEGGNDGLGRFERQKQELQQPKQPPPKEATVQNMAPLALDSLRTASTVQFGEQ